MQHVENTPIIASEPDDTPLLIRQLTEQILNAPGFVGLERQLSIPNFLNALKDYNEMPKVQQKLLDNRFLLDTLFNKV